MAGGFRCCPLWREGGQGPWVLVPAPFSLSVSGRVPLAPHPRVGKVPAFHLSLGGRGDKNDQSLQGAGGREMLGQTGQRESHALGCLIWFGERRLLPGAGQCPSRALPRRVLMLGLAFSSNGEFVNLLNQNNHLLQTPPIAVGMNAPITVEGLTATGGLPMGLTCWAHLRPGSDRLSCPCPPSPPRANCPSGPTLLSTLGEAWFLQGIRCRACRTDPGPLTDCMRDCMGCFIVTESG